MTTKQPMSVKSMEKKATLANYMLIDDSEQYAPIPCETYDDAAKIKHFFESIEGTDHYPTHEPMELRIEAQTDVMTYSTFLASYLGDVAEGII